MGILDSLLRSIFNCDKSLLCRKSATSRAKTSDADLITAQRKARAAQKDNGTLIHLCYKPYY